MKRTFALLASASALTGALLASPVLAQFKNADDAVHYRQSVFTVMGNHFGRLAAMAKGEQPFDADQAKASAELVKTMSKLPWEAFVPGSDAGKANVKGDPLAHLDDIKALREKMMAQADKLPEAAGSLDTLRAQVGETGKTCKACHDKYRKQ